MIVKPGLAMAMCVRNEAGLLPANLAYHRALGVRRAYVFLDRCTDGSEQIAAAFPWVHPIRLDPAQVEKLEYVPDLHRLCFDHALGLAREEGFDWLMVLDADEFAFAANPVIRTRRHNSDLIRGNLPAMLSRAAAGTEQIRLHPKELVPAGLADDAPFWKQCYFQDGHSLTRDILDPLNGEVRNWSGMLAHDWGKSIVRTSSHVQSFGSHSWVPYQGRFLPQRPAMAPLKTEELGFHYHFVFTSRQHWYDKYRKLSHEPANWFFGGPVEFTKQCWKRAVSTLREDELERYYHRWVALPEPHLDQLAQMGVVQKEVCVEHVLREAGVLVNNHCNVPPAPKRNRIEEWDMPPFDVSSKPEGMRRVCPATGTVTYTPAEMDRDMARGFMLTELSDGKLFRWTAPIAEMRIDLPPDNYLMTLHMPHMQGLWRGELCVVIDEKPVPRRELTVANGEVSTALSRVDFGPTSQHWLRLIFKPIDTSQWPAPDPRDLGAPLFEVSFKPIQDRSVVASR